MSDFALMFKASTYESDKQTFIMNNKFQPFGNYIKNIDKNKRN